MDTWVITIFHLKFWRSEHFISCSDGHLDKCISFLGRCPQGTLSNFSFLWGSVQLLSVLQDSVRRYILWKLVLHSPFYDRFLFPQLLQHPVLFCTEILAIWLCAVTTRNIFSSPSPYLAESAARIGSLEKLRMTSYSQPYSCASHTGWHILGSHKHFPNDWHVSSPSHPSSELNSHPTVKTKISRGNAFWTKHSGQNVDHSLMMMMMLLMELWISLLSERLQVTGY